MQESAGATFNSSPAWNLSELPQVSNQGLGAMGPSKNYLQVKRSGVAGWDTETYKNQSAEKCRLCRLNQIKTDVQMLCPFAWNNISDNALESELVIAHLPPDSVEKPAV